MMMMMRRRWLFWGLYLVLFSYDICLVSCFVLFTIWLLEFKTQSLHFYLVKWTSFMMIMMKALLSPSCSGVVQGKALTFSFFSSDFFVFLSFTEPERRESERRPCLPVALGSSWLLEEPGWSRPRAALSRTGSAGCSSAFHLWETSVTCSERVNNAICQTSRVCRRSASRGQIEAMCFMSFGARWNNRGHAEGF